MTTQHRPWNFIAGDDWMLNVQLLDADNKPYNSQDIEIKWLLHNPNGEIVPHNFMINHIDAPAGKITIWIPSNITTDFAGGAWTDWVRIVCNGIVSTLLTGPISVTADPWKATIAITSTIAPMAAMQSAGDVVVTLHRERIMRQPKRGTTSREAKATVVDKDNPTAEVAGNKAEVVVARAFRAQA